jgi:hypothetical protein
LAQNINQKGQGLGTGGWRIGDSKFRIQDEEVRCVPAEIVPAADAYGFIL